MAVRKKKSVNDSMLKEIPSVQEILAHPSLQEAEVDVRYLRNFVQAVIQQHREKIRSGDVRGVHREALTGRIVRDVQQQISKYMVFRMKRVINATGIILHTNLGRAPLATPARQHLQEIMENYCNLEIDLRSGKRGDRLATVEEMICLITGAEASAVVNNNAAAVLLVLNTLCRRKEVPVSRGELVEIGGSFRMPEVMKAGGAKMVEVGTTNKTHLKDYREAISPRTAAILKVHTSNYRIQGFTESVPIDKLTALAHRFELPVIYDMGSGVMEALENWGYSHEPVAREYVEAGVDVITFSGDKVLGGPQAGIIIGKKRHLQKIKKNHLLRALRCDKLTYALLEATLRLYLNPENLPRNLPVAGMLTLTSQELRNRACSLKEKIRGLPLTAEVIETYSQMGSGALPLEKIPSVAVRIVPQKMSVNRFAKMVRLQQPALIGYIENDAFLINLRTVRKDELPEVEKIIRTVFV